MAELGMQIAQQYLRPSDKLIGVIGDAGSGKSMLVKGMFPGLELTNDDEGVNVRPLPLLEMLDDPLGMGTISKKGFSLFATPHTYHLDIRFEQGFTQCPELARAIMAAINKGKRVVVEHFDLVYPLLGFNANLLIAVGEQITLARPTLFGPEPQDLRAVAYDSLSYRLMAHTAEDLCEFCMSPEDLARCGHDDVRHGFVISFPDRAPEFDIQQLEEKVSRMIQENLPVTYADSRHVSINGQLHPCTGPRIHVASTGQVKDFHLLYHFMHDVFNKRYLLVGCVGRDNLDKLRKLEEHTKFLHPIE